MPKCKRQEIKIATPLPIIDEKTIKAGQHYCKGEEKIFMVDTFYNELIWEQVIVGLEHKPIYKVWKYWKDTLPCPSCAKTSDMTYNIQKVGVYGRCMFCNVTIGISPMDIETGEPTADLLSEAIVSLEEAYAIMKRIGQDPPQGLPPLRSRRARRHE